MYLGKRETLGDGLYLKRGGCHRRIETDGEGLYLTPVSGRGLGSMDDGADMYSRGKDLYDGRGLILGENSPFRTFQFLVCYCSK